MLIPCDAEFSWGAYLSRERERERGEKILRLIVIIILDMNSFIEGKSKGMVDVDFR